MIPPCYVAEIPVAALREALEKAFPGCRAQILITHETGRELTVREEHAAERAVAEYRARVEPTS